MNDTTRTWIKDGLWAVVFAGLIASIIRFTSGLGTATGYERLGSLGIVDRLQAGFRGPGRRRIHAGRHGLYFPPGKIPPHPAPGDPDGVAGIWFVYRLADFRPGPALAHLHANHQLAAPLGHVRDCLVRDPLFLGLGDGVFPGHPGTPLVQPSDLQNDCALAASANPATHHRRDRALDTASIILRLAVPDHDPACPSAMVQPVDPLYVLHQRHRCWHDGTHRGRLPGRTLVQDGK